MIDTNPYNSAVNKASIETSRFLSAHLRTQARASGWPDDLARSMSVSYKQDGFNVNVHKSQYDKVMDLEYGTTDTEPTAAIRRTMNRTEQAQSFFVGRLSRMLGGSL